MAEAKINKMQNYPVLELIKHSFAFTVLSYGGWHLLNDCCSSYVPVGILLTTLLTGSVLYLRVPAPSKSAVEKILGKDISEDVGVDDYVIRTIAHRGAGLDAPENTLAAFKMCKQKGCDVIEFDITLTADGVPVVFHDKTLERMADTNLNVNEHKWKDLQEINISSKHPFKDRFPVTNIPTLDDSIRQFIECGQRIFIDLKDNDSRMVGVIINLYKKFPDLYSMAVVTTFYPNLIYMLRRQDPKIVCSMAWRPHAFAYESYNFPKGRGEARSKVWYRHYFLEMCDLLHEWMLPRITYYLLGLSVILLHKDAINPKSVVDWRNKGLRVMAWTVNTPSEKQYLAKVLKITYLTDTLTGESSTHLNSSVSSF